MTHHDHPLTRLSRGVVTQRQGGERTAAADFQHGQIEPAVEGMHRLDAQLISIGQLYPNRSALADHVKVRDNQSILGDKETGSQPPRLTVAVVRLDASGQLDPTFDDDGLFTYSKTDVDNGMSIVPALDGGQYVTGYSIGFDAAPADIVLKLAGAVAPPVNHAPTVATVSGPATSPETNQPATFTATFADVDDGDHVALGGVVVRLLRIGGDRMHGNGHAGRVRERQIPLRRHRLGGRDGKLARLRRAVKRQRLFVGERANLVGHQGPARVKEGSPP